MATPIERKRIRWIAAILGGALAAAVAFVALKEVRRARAQDGMIECQNWIGAIDEAKEVFAVKEAKKAGDPVEWADLVKPGQAGYLSEDRRKCAHTVADYVIGKIGEEVSCSSGVAGHSAGGGVVIDEATGKPKFVR